MDVDKDKSYCFKNKQDSNWVGIRYGWAIVTFKSKRARNKYLEDEDRHFVRETENSPYEKLKVSPWFDKPKAKQPNKSEKTNKIPLYKSDLEKEVYDQSYNFFKNQTNLTVEEFTRGCTDTSIQVFKGRVSSYIASQAGQPGHVGDLEILLSHGKAELVIFHSDTVWLPDHTGIVDSPVRCGVDNFLENRLQVCFNQTDQPYVSTLPTNQITILAVGGIVRWFAGRDGCLVHGAATSDRDSGGQAFPGQVSVAGQ